MGTPHKTHFSIISCFLLKFSPKNSRARRLNHIYQLTTVSSHGNSVIGLQLSMSVAVFLRVIYIVVRAEEHKIMFNQCKGIFLKFTVQYNQRGRKVSWLTGLHEDREFWRVKNDVTARGAPVNARPDTRHSFQPQNGTRRIRKNLQSARWHKVLGRTGGDLIMNFLRSGPS